MYQLHFAEPNHLTDGDELTLQIDEYDDLGSMYMLELRDGTTQSIGKQLVDSIETVDQ